jgi:V8-like Glu-specific endopeptidase
MAGMRFQAGLILGALLCLPGAASAAGPTGAAGFPISHHRFGESRRSILNYWTPARIRGADPRPVRVVGGGVPAPGASAQRRASNPVHEVPDYDVPPNNANGKLLGRDSGGGYTCSATVVRSRNLNEIVTAGHCVHTIQFGWARKLLFIPAYHQGDAPFGKWAGREASAQRQWVRSENSNYDYAAIVLARSNKRAIQNVVGAARLAWNQGREQDYHAVGYPGNHFSARRMVACDSPFVRRDPFDATSGPAPTGIRCGDMGPGASGGGWWIDGSFIDSVTSFGYAFEPSLVYGPYFDRDTKDLVRRAGRAR